MMKLIALKLKRLYRWVIVWLKKIPYIDGLSLYDVIEKFVLGIVEGAVTNRAASVAFSFFLALFPGILFLFSLIPYIQISGFQDEIYHLLQDILPPTSYDAAQSTISDILNNRRGNVLGFGFFFALVFATNGINALLSNFSQSFHHLESRNFWQQWIAAFILTIFLSILLIVGVALITLSGNVTDYFVNRGWITEGLAAIISYSRTTLILAIVLFSISLILYFSPNKRRTWRLFSPGAILAFVLVLLSSLAFDWYVQNFSQYNKLYGSIGTLIVILLWIYINSIGLIIGYELNASIAVARNDNRGK
jgi:membrane protein